MALLRGFSKVDPVAEGTGGGGRIFIPSNMREKAAISADSMVEIEIIRIKGSSRWPYMIVHAPGVSPRLTNFQVVINEKQSRIDNESSLIMTDNDLEETKLQPNYRVEIKLHGPVRGSWLVIHNRGPNKLTTLQEKMGRFGKNERSGKKWQTQQWNY